MLTHTQINTQTILNTSQIESFPEQLAAILIDSKFVAIPTQLYTKSLNIFERKMDVLLTEITQLVEMGVDNLDDEHMDEILDRIEFAQKYFFEEAFDKSVESFLDMYLISDLDDELRAYRHLEVYFHTLSTQIQHYLHSINYPQFIGQLNAKLS
jgi:hypothetical protein